MSRDYLPIILFVLPILWIVSITLMIDYLMVGIILNVITIFVAFFCTIKYTGIRRKNKIDEKKEVANVYSDFEEKYNFINENYIEPLKNVKKNNKGKRIYLMMVLIGLILSIVFRNYIFTKIDYTSGAFIILGLIVVYKFLDNDKWKDIYTEKFKDNAIANFLKSLNKNIHYSHSVRKYPQTENEDAKNVSDVCKYVDIKHGWTTIDDEIRWVTNDEIKCNLFSVLLEDLFYNGTGKHTVFKGLLGYARNNDYNIEQSICISLKERFAGNGTKIVMNNIAFEDIFSVHSRNKDAVDLIVTEELMNCIMKIYEESNLDFFITMKGNAIYYQFFTGSQTDVKNFQHKNHLFCYYYSIKMMEETSKIINKNISQIEVSALKSE